MSLHILNIIKYLFEILYINKLLLSLHSSYAADPIEKEPCIRQHMLLLSARLILSSLSAERYTFFRLMEMAPKYIMFIRTLKPDSVSNPFGFYEIYDFDFQ